MKHFLISVIIILTFAECNTPAKQDKRTITVTVEPLKYFTEQIAGEKFNVVAMVSSSDNPETYEPTAQQMINLAHSDMYIKVGAIGFERTWMKRIVKNTPHLIIIDSSDGIETEMTTCGTEDPHTWMSARNARIISENIYKALARIAPSDKEYFKERLELLHDRIDSTDVVVRKNLKATKAKTFLIYHPALTYFARDYGLKQMQIEDEGREPSAAQLENIISTAKQNKVETMFVQAQYKNRNTEIVAQSIGARLVEINPLNYDWTQEMVNISRLLK